MAHLWEHSFYVRVLVKYVNFNKTQIDNSNQMFYGVMIMFYALEKINAKRKAALVEIKGARVIRIFMRNVGSCLWVNRISVEIFCAQTYSKTRFPIGNMDDGKWSVFVSHRSVREYIRIKVSVQRCNAEATHTVSRASS